VDEAWLSRKPHRRHLERAAAAGDEIEATGERAIIEAALAASRGRVAGPSGATAKLNGPPSTLESRIKALPIRSRYAGGDENFVLVLPAHVGLDDRTRLHSDFTGPKGPLLTSISRRDIKGGALG
jgi:hypothetical protein